MHRTNDIDLFQRAEPRQNLYMMISRRQNPTVLGLIFLGHLREMESSFRWNLWHLLVGELWFQCIHWFFGPREWTQLQRSGRGTSGMQPLTALGTSQFFVSLSFSFRRWGSLWILLIQDPWEGVSCRCGFSGWAQGQCLFPSSKWFDLLTLEGEGPFKVGQGLAGITVAGHKAGTNS